MGGPSAPSPPLLLSVHGAISDGKGLVTKYGEGGGAHEVLPLRKGGGGGKVLAMLKGVHQFLG